MAVTSENSDLVANIDASPQVFNDNNKSKGQVLVEVFEFTQGAAAGDALSIARLCKLPPRARYISHLSRIRFSAFGAARTLDIGWEAYTDGDGTSVVADPNGLADGIDVSAAGAAVLNDAPTVAVESKEFLGEVVLTAQVVGGTIPAAATIKGVIAYAMP